MNTLQAFAEQLLFGNRLEDKLFVPEQIEFQDFTAISSPERPGRPSSLLFSKEKLLFPKDFSAPEARGTALQFFANHELLAIELMALCLLRFPNAPINFQRGIVHIISEEQEHLRLYLKRSKSLGVEIGAVPVNSFFWDCLSKMDSEMDFVTGMGLTFEQANLDHCIYYRRLFDAVDDTETVGILDQVYVDELRHVKHGLHWFRKWKPADRTDFFVHEQRLKLPLSPMRAKGLIFDMKARQDIGFDDDYISQLQVYSLSKGRPSDIYLFRPNCELDQTGQEPKKIAKEMERILAPLMLFMAQKDDIVQAPRPSVSQLQEFQRVGINLPQFVADLKELKGRNLGEYKSWGWSEKIAEEVGVTFPIGHRKLYGKSWGADCLREYLTKFQTDFICSPDTVGRVCRTEEELLAESEKLHQLGYLDHILKAEFGTAGRGATRDSYPYELKTLVWARKVLRLQGQLVLEPRLERLVDYSIQCQVSPSQIKEVTVGRFETSEQGQYLGHHIGSFQRGMERDILRFLHGDGKDRHRFRQINSQVAHLVGRKLQAENFQGAVGIDAFIFRDSNGVLKIRPLVEVNPRITMGRIAFEVGKYVHPKSYGRFLITSRKEVEWRKIGRKAGRWASGTIPLTDSEQPILAVLELYQP